MRRSKFMEGLKYSCTAMDFNREAFRNKFLTDDKLEMAEYAHRLVLIERLHPKESHKTFLYYEPVSRKIMDSISCIIGSKIDQQFTNPHVYRHDNEHLHSILEGLEFNKEVFEMNFKHHHKFAFHDWVMSHGNFRNFKEILGFPVAFIGDWIKQIDGLDFKQFYSCNPDLIISFGFDRATAAVFLRPL